MKQSGLFSFLRIYESGHEVPFYQPLASLEIFERALAQVDIATGKEKVCDNLDYRTVGTRTSEYREGNATVQFDLTPSNATYNRELNAPDPVPTWAPPNAKKTMRHMNGKRSLGKLGRPRRSKGGKRPA